MEFVRKNGNSPDECINALRKEIVYDKIEVFNKNKVNVLTCVNNSEEKDIPNNTLPKDFRLFISITNKEKEYKGEMTVSCTKGYVLGIELPEENIKR